MDDLAELEVLLVGDLLRHRAAGAVPLERLPLLVGGDKVRPDSADDVGIDGEPREEVLRSVLWQGLKLATLGVALGMGLSVAGTRLLRTLLFEIKPIDPATLGLAAVVVVILTLTASYLPARRASLIEPAVALREG